MAPDSEMSHSRANAVPNPVSSEKASAKSSAAFRTSWSDMTSIPFRRINGNHAPFGGAAKATGNAYRPYQSVAITIAGNGTNLM